MCAHLIDAGYRLTVHTRTKSKAESLFDKGARWAGDPTDMPASCDVIFTMVGYPADVREIYLGTGGLVSALRPGCVVVDMTTTKPSLSQEIHAVAQERGGYAIDAPVSGGDVGARDAALSIMVGGDKPAVDAVMPLLEFLGKTIVYQGDAGSGQHAKMCNQIVIAGTMIGMCEALVYGYQAGLDLETMLSSIRGGAAGCWSLENYAPRIFRRDLAPGFFVDHFIKDMEIALEESRRMGVVLPGLALVHQLYLAVRSAGHGKSGTQALIVALERLADVELASSQSAS